MFDPSKSLKKMLGPRTNVPRFGARTKNDWDGDGVSNKIDCQPRNPTRQDNNSFNKYGWKINQIKKSGNFKYINKIMFKDGSIWEYLEDHDGAFISNIKTGENKDLPKGFNEENNKL